MAWNYVNFAAMIVGYITIALVTLMLLAFIALVLREKYNDWKWRKQKEKEKQASPLVSSAVVNKPAEQPKEPAKETSGNPNAQLSTNKD